MRKVFNQDDGTLDIPEIEPLHPAVIDGMGHEDIFQWFYDRIIAIVSLNLDLDDDECVRVLTKLFKSREELAKNNIRLHGSRRLNKSDLCRALIGLHDLSEHLYFRMNSISSNDFLIKFCFGRSLYINIRLQPGRAMTFDTTSLSDLSFIPLKTPFMDELVCLRGQGPYGMYALWYFLRNERGIYLQKV